MFLYLSENDAFTPKTNNGSHTSPKEKNFINNAVEICIILFLFIRNF
jgi:hypothetical protein